MTIIYLGNRIIYQFKNSSRFEVYAYLQAANYVLYDILR
jgi:hypothetical protein